MHAAIAFGLDDTLEVVLTIEVESFGVGLERGTQSLAFDRAIEQLSAGAQRYTSMLPIATRGTRLSVHQLANQGLVKMPLAARCFIVSSQAAQEGREMVLLLEFQGEGFCGLE